MNHWQPLGNLHQILKYTLPFNTVILPDDNASAIKDPQGFFGVVLHALVTMSGINEYKLRLAVVSKVREIVCHRISMALNNFMFD